MFSAATFGCCSKIFRCSNKKNIFVVPNFNAVTKPFFPVQRCRSKTEINILEDIFSSVLSQFKKYYPFGNQKFNNLRIFQSLRCVFKWKKNPSNFS